MSKKKVISLVVIAFFVLIASASIISYSIATKGNGESKNVESGLTNRAASVSDMNYLSNIDLIIDSSNNGDKYNIIEIAPKGVSASDLGTYISNGGFKSYVIDANKEQSASMKDNMITYNCINVDATSTLEDAYGEATIQSTLDAADLIYVNCPLYTSYDGSNNMSEEIYNYLHTYALGSDKPIIMDYITKASTGVSSCTKYLDLVKAISNNNIKYRTFGWSAEDSGEDFFGGARFFKFNANDNVATGKVLILTTGSDGSDSMQSKMKTFGEGSVISTAYYGKNSNLPDSITYTEANPNTVTPSQLEGYDFVLIENSAMSCTIAQEVYAKIKELSETSKYIIYDSRSLSSGGSSEAVTETNNYVKLMNLLINSKGISRYANVLSSSNGFFTSLNSAGENGLAGAKTIADIINAGDYRGSGSKGKNGKVYRVLELQPCYPIDTDLAQSRSNGSGMQYSAGVKGNYYTSPSDVMFNVTKDEVDGETDYYDFDLSKAKIAYATGLKMSQIQLDSMSTDEFISKKDVVLETYDLVYIGGNVSALTLGSTKTFIGYLGIKYNNSIRKLMTSFDMYTHTGQMVTLQTAGTYNETMMNKVKNTPGQTISDAYGSVYINGKKQATTVELNGNDINNIKYQELKDYMDAGMPIIIEKEVADAFKESKDKEDKRLEQLALGKLDPDSWMYKALDYAYGKSGSAQVNWGLDAISTEVKVDNSDLKYGNTAGSEVTVFNQTVNDQINALINASSIRPTLTIEDAPKEYIEGNKNSFNQTKDGFSIETYAKTSSKDGDGKFKISLYIDVNGNGVFSDGPISADGECAQSVSYTYSEKQDSSGNTIPTTTKLAYKDLDPDFYGIISWKVVAVEEATGLISSRTGYAYYEKSEDVDKKEIKILQIMPRPEKIKNDMDSAVKNNTMLQTPENDGHSLYLCTECQLNMYRAKYNIYNNGTVGRNTSATQNTIQGVSMGLHEHKFGIVKYDSTLGNEDWESNFADDISSDYDADIDIIYADEFEDIVASVQKNSKEETEAYKMLAVQSKSNWESAQTELEESGIEEKLKAKLESMQGDANVKMSSMCKQFAADGEYYKVWYYNLNGSNIQYNATLSSYRTLYNQYVELHDKVVQAKQNYKQYSRLAYAADKWLAMNYDMIVLGFAEDFGGEDMNADACKMLADYVDKGGSMLNTHDSTTRYEKAGAMNITSNLRETFGMDRYHITGVSEGSGSGEATALESNASVSVASFAYTKDIENPVDATYRATITMNGVQQFKEFTINKNEYINFSWTAHYHTFTDGYNLESATASTLGTSQSKITFNVTGHEGSWDNGPSVNCPDGTAVTVSKKSASNEWVQVAAGVTAAGTVTLNIPKATEIITGKTTKAVSDIVSLKETDKEFNVVTVPSSDGGNGTINLTSEGSAYNDVTKKMSLKFKVNIPDGAGYYEATDTAITDFSGINVSIVYNGVRYTRSTNTLGVVTFDIPQISSIDAHNISANSLRYRKFTTADSSLYFFTERAITTDNAIWNKMMLDGTMADPADGNITSNWASFGYNSPIGLTDSVMIFRTSQYNSTPYRYLQYMYDSAITWDMGYEIKTEGYGPNGASQVNEGIVTVYPFKISSELKISKTHSQTYALDLEDEDVSVWYTLSSGVGTTKEGASLYAASPHDGMDNYYLYSKGNVFYCGAGHSVVTGPKRDNNDERRLFINIIVNSVRNAASKPKISLHEKDTEGAEVTSDKTEGNLFIDNDGAYYYTVDDKEATPEFDFKVRVDSKVDLAEVLVYYDLNYGVKNSSGVANYSNDYTNDANHVLIAEYNTSADNPLVSKQLAKLREYTKTPEAGYKNLKLKQSYFDNYGDYTYIVIKATDTNEKVSYQRLKIKLIPHLFDLTDATFDSQSQPVASISFMLDMTDKNKFNI